MKPTENSKAGFSCFFLAGVCGVPKRFCEGSNGRKSNTSRVQISARMKKLQTKGTFILKNKGRFFKVITVRPVGDNRYVFGCRELVSKKSEVLTFRMLGLLEAMDAAARVMKDPKDILLVDLDNQGKWKIMTKDQIDKATKRH
jgi:hypothetical protein